MSEKSVWYVYMHLKADAKTPYYIGLGKKQPNHGNTRESEFARAYCTTQSNRSKPWYRGYLIHGVIVDILADNLTFDQAAVLERTFIKYYGRYKYGGPLCNLTDGGEGLDGFEHSQESKAKMSRSAKNRKKKRSLESRAALSKLLQEQRAKKIFCKTNGKLYTNRYEAKNELFPNIRSSHRSITLACETGKPYNGFIFYHVDTNNQPIIITPKPKKIPGEKLTPDMRQEVLTLHSQGWTHPQIAAKFNVNRMTILRYLNGRSWYK